MLYAVGGNSGIYCIENAGEARLYFVDGPEPVLIDAGSPGTSDRIVRDLASLGVRPIDIKKIILTHHHEENVGTLWELYKRTGAKICAHSLDADYISGKRVRRRRRVTLRRAYHSAVATVWGGEARPMPVDLLLENGDEVAGLRVIHTPGHTPGHICLLKGEALFSGDLLEPRPGHFVEFSVDEIDDVPMSRQSIARVAEVRFQAILPSHQPPYVFGAGRRVRQLAQKLGHYRWDEEADESPDPDAI